MELPRPKPAAIPPEASKSGFVPKLHGAIASLTLLRRGTGSQYPGDTLHSPLPCLSLVRFSRAMPNPLTYPGIHGDFRVLTNP